MHSFVYVPTIDDTPPTVPHASVAFLLRGLGCGFRRNPRASRIIYIYSVRRGVGIRRGDLKIYPRNETRRYKLTAFINPARRYTYICMFAAAFFGHPMRGMIRGVVGGCLPRNWGVNSFPEKYANALPHRIRYAKTCRAAPVRSPAPGSSNPCIPPVLLLVTVSSCGYYNLSLSYFISERLLRLPSYHPSDKGFAFYVSSGMSRI